MATKHRAPEACTDAQPPITLSLNVSDSRLTTVAQCERQSFISMTRRQGWGRVRHGNPGSERACFIFRWHGTISPRPITEPAAAAATVRSGAPCKGHRRRRAITSQRFGGQGHERRPRTELTKLLPAWPILFSALATGAGAGDGLRGAATAAEGSLSSPPRSSEASLASARVARSVRHADAASRRRLTVSAKTAASSARSGDTERSLTSRWPPDGWAGVALSGDWGRLLTSRRPLDGWAGSALAGDWGRSRTSRPVHGWAGSALAGDWERLLTSRRPLDGLAGSALAGDWVRFLASWRPLDGWAGSALTGDWVRLLTSRRPVHCCSGSALAGDWGR